ncbi:uncharacterized protein [Macrobrachium rosenbergii]|uniref:uncharacterized protein n=1 Tax=Macrobrachium rosenbergii TaxID=79674 RepID=UPI0034D7B89A
MRPTVTRVWQATLLWFLASSHLLHRVYCLTSIYDPEEDKVVELFREADQQGEGRTLYWHTSTLPEEWRSLRQSGVWIYYSEEDYGGENVTVVFGDGVAINIFHPVRSVRYAGNTRSSALPALLLYKETWFRGPEYYIEAEDGDALVMIPNFRDLGTNAQSMILVGSEWTTFPRENFRGGSCWCLRPTHFTITSGDEKEIMKASFYPNLTATVEGSVGSAMLSCEDVPMKEFCRSLDEEEVNRSQCPVLTNGRVEYCNNR